jgi:hypothetical protein
MVPGPWWAVSDPAGIGRSTPPASGPSPAAVGPRIWQVLQLLRLSLLPVPIVPADGRPAVGCRSEAGPLQPIPRRPFRLVPGHRFRIIPAAETVLQRAQLAPSLRYG